jgi:hypothetical protein
MKKGEVYFLGFLTILLLACVPSFGAVVINDDFSVPGWNQQVWMRNDANCNNIDADYHLLVNGNATGHAWTQSVAAFNPGVASGGTVFDWVEKHYGNNSFMGLHYGNQGYWGLPNGILFRSDQNDNWWITIKKASSPSWDVCVDTGIYAGALYDAVNTRFQIVWNTDSITMKIDRGNKGTWDFNQTYNVTMSGPLPLQFAQNNQPAFLSIIGATVTTDAPYAYTYYAYSSSNTPLAYYWNQMTVSNPDKLPPGRTSWASYVFASDKQPTLDDSASVVMFGQDPDAGWIYGYSTVRLATPIVPNGTYKVKIIYKRINDMPFLTYRDKLHPYWTEVSLVDPAGPFGGPTGAGTQKWGELTLYDAVTITDGSYWIELRDLCSGQSSEQRNPFYQWQLATVEAFRLYPTEPVAWTPGVYYSFPSLDAGVGYSLWNGDNAASAGLNTIGQSGAPVLGLSNNDKVGGGRITLPHANVIADVNVMMYAANDLGYTSEIGRAHV